ncbi:MAG: helix-turn-helix transcriptional regulator [Deltaproteobacteria bacterium]|nr:helix-turn-helix transcriptional regulator [Deltaproteobacteria bacterium]
MSQSDLARISGLQPSAISHFENGRRSPSFENLKKIADALSVSIDYLIGRDADTGAGGPTIQRIFRGASEMSKSDLDTFAEMAEMLAAKKKKEKKGDER